MIRPCLVLDSALNFFHRLFSWEALLPFKEKQQFAKGMAGTHPGDHLHHAVGYCVLPK